jgi:hypothetical protein
MRNLSHFPKTDIRFWQRAVFRQPYIVDGQRRLTKEWYARVQFQGKRAFFQLGTPNRAAGAERRETYFCSSPSTVGPRRLRGIRRGLNRRRQQILPKLRSVPFLTRCSASARTDPRSKGTQLRSGKSSPTSSGSPLTRQNSITDPAAGANG